MRCNLLSMVVAEILSQEKEKFVYEYVNALDNGPGTYFPTFCLRLLF